MDKSKSKSEKNTDHRDDPWSGSRDFAHISGSKQQDA